MEPTTESPVSRLRRAQLRTYYERDLASRSALVAIDVVRFERWAKMFASYEPLRAHDPSSRISHHLDETERLLALLLASLTRLARHLESPL